MTLSSGDRNNIRLPATHRLDLGISFYKKKRWGDRWWNIGVYNAYNRFNPMFVQQGVGGTDSGDSQFWFDVYTVFPFMPSVAYRIQIGK